MAPASSAPARATRRARSDCEPSRREPPSPRTLIARVAVTPTRLNARLRCRAMTEGTASHLATSTYRRVAFGRHRRREEHVTIPANIRVQAAAAQLLYALPRPLRDRKSTRLNSSHVKISYAV